MKWTNNSTACTGVALRVKWPEYARCLWCLPHGTRGVVYYLHHPHHHHHHHYFTSGQEKQRNQQFVTLFSLLPLDQSRPAPCRESATPAAVQTFTIRQLMVTVTQMATSASELCLPKTVAFLLEPWQAPNSCSLLAL